MSEAKDHPAHPPKKSSAALRTLILLVLLVLIVGGGLWDWYGAKEPRDEAYDRVLALQSGATGMASASQPATTQADVQKAVGTAPSESTNEDGVIYERYSWRRGIPWMTYDLWVLYREDDRKEMLVAQLGEEGKPDPIYAANSRGTEPPMPDPATVRPIVDGESPYPPPRTAEPAEETTPAEASTEAGDETTETREATAEAPAEGASEAPAESPAPTTPVEQPAEGETSPNEPETEESENADASP